MADVVLVALNPMLRAAELTHALVRSDAVLLLHAEQSRDYDMAAVAAEVCAELPEIRRLALGELITEPAHDAAADRKRVDHGGVAIVQFTSGTTGMPKAVVLTHRSVVNVAKLFLARSARVNPPWVLLPAWHLAPQKVPRRWFVADELPVTATGKVRRIAVREAVVAGNFRAM